jgi:HlyD family secretion protein
MKSNLFLLLIAAAILYSIHLQKNDEPRQPLDGQPAPMTVTTVHPTQANLEEVIYASGVTVAKEVITLHAELPQTRITDIFKEAGDWVNAGDLLALLDTSSLTHQLTQIEAQLKEASKSFERAKKIKGSGAITDDVFDQKEALFLTLQAQKNELLVTLQKTNITTPAAGLIYERQASIGAVAGSSPLFYIAKDGVIELEAHISEATLKYFKTNQLVTIQLMDALPLEGHVRLISPKIEANRVARVRVAFANPPKPLSIYAFGKVSVIAQAKAGLSVPISAIVLKNNQTVVWIVQENRKVVKVPVTVTLRANNRAIIESPQITPDSVIVAKAGSFLKEGDTVLFVPDQTPKEPKPPGEPQQEVARVIDTNAVAGMAP